MRAILVITILFSVVGLKAQTFMPAGIVGYAPLTGFTNNISPNQFPQKKWSVTRYSGISTSFSFFRGGSATILSVPLGLQVNRVLTNNLYAFANVTAAPAYVNFNQSFLNTRFGKTNPGGFSGPGSSLGIYTAASMGLTYVNDDRTFSISGSISVERGSSPLLPLYPAYNSRPAPSAAVKR